MGACGWQFKYFDTENNIFSQYENWASTNGFNTTSQTKIQFGTTMAQFLDSNSGLYYRSSVAFETEERKEVKGITVSTPWIVSSDVNFGFFGVALWCSHFGAQISSKLFY